MERRVNNANKMNKTNNRNTTNNETQKNSKNKKNAKSGGTTNDSETFHNSNNDRETGPTLPPRKLYQHFSKRSLSMKDINQSRMIRDHTNNGATDGDYLKNDNDKRRISWKRNERRESYKSDDNKDIQLDREYDNTNTTNDNKNNDTSNFGPNVRIVGDDIKISINDNAQESTRSQKSEFEHSGITKKAKMDSEYNNGKQHNNFINNDNNGFITKKKEIDKKSSFSYDTNHEEIKYDNDTHYNQSKHKLSKSKLLEPRPEKQTNHHYPHHHHQSSPYSSSSRLPKNNDNNNNGNNGNDTNDGMTSVNEDDKYYNYKRNENDELDNIDNMCIKEDYLKKRKYYQISDNNDMREPDQKKEEEQLGNANNQNRYSDDIRRTNYDERSNPKYHIDDHNRNYNYYHVHKKQRTNDRYSKQSSNNGHASHEEMNRERNYTKNNTPTDFQYQRKKEYQHTSSASFPRIDRSYDDRTGIGNNDSYGDPIKEKEQSFNDQRPTANYNDRNNTHKSGSSTSSSSGNSGKSSSTYGTNGGYGHGSYRNNHNYNHSDNYYNNNDSREHYYNNRYDRYNRYDKYDRYGRYHNNYNTSNDNTAAMEEKYGRNSKNKLSRHSYRRHESLNENVSGSKSSVDLEKNLNTQTISRNIKNSNGGVDGTNDMIRNDLNQNIITSNGTTDHKAPTHDTEDCNTDKWSIRQKLHSHYNRGYGDNNIIMNIDFSGISNMANRNETIKQNMYKNIPEPYLDHDPSYQSWNVDTRSNDELIDHYSRIQNGEKKEESVPSLLTSTLDHYDNANKNKSSKGKKEDTRKKEDNFIVIRDNPKKDKEGEYRVPMNPSTSYFPIVESIDKKKNSDYDHDEKKSNSKNTDTDNNDNSKLGDEESSIVDVILFDLGAHSEQCSVCDQNIRFIIQKYYGDGFDDRGTRIDLDTAKTEINKWLHFCPGCRTFSHYQCVLPLIRQKADTTYILCKTCNHELLLL